MRRTSLSAVAGITVFLMTTLAVAQVRYVDEKGVPHWVSSPDEVPQQYRNTATNPRLPEINPQKGGGRSGPLSDRLSARCRTEILTVQEMAQERWQKFGQQPLVGMSKECERELQEAMGVPSKQNMSDACDRQFDFATQMTKKQWQDYGKRVPIREYLTPECAAEISKAYPRTRLDD